MTTLTKGQRRALSDHLGFLKVESDRLITPEYTEITAKLKRIEEQRGVVLELAGLTDEPQQCGNCMELVLPGDQVSEYAEEGLVFCEPCAPTYRYLLAELAESSEEDLREHYGQDDGAPETKAQILARLADNWRDCLDDKAVHVLAE